jgi:hypothetical protein
MSAVGATEVVTPLESVKEMITGEADAAEAPEASLPTSQRKPFASAGVSALMLESCTIASTGAVVLNGKGEPAREEATPMPTDKPMTARMDTMVIGMIPEQLFATADTRGAGG